MRKVIATVSSKTTHLGFCPITIKSKILFKSVLLPTLLLWVVILAVAFATGFANFNTHSSQSDPSNRKGILINKYKGDKMINYKNHSKVSVVVQCLKGCPNSPKMLKNVQGAIKGFRKTVGYEELLIKSQEEAEAIGFRGSPTLLINGRDFEDIPVPKIISLTCRVYQDGIPNPDVIKKRTLELLQ